MNFESEGLNHFIVFYCLLLVAVFDVTTNYCILLYFSVGATGSKLVRRPGHFPENYRPVLLGGVGARPVSCGPLRTPLVLQKGRRPAAQKINFSKTLKVD